MLALLAWPPRWRLMHLVAIVWLYHLENLVCLTSYVHLHKRWPLLLADFGMRPDSNVDAEGPLAARLSLLRRSL